MVSVAWLVAAVGIIAFYRWGRTLYFALTLLAVVSAPFAGVNVLGAWESAFLNAALVLDGAALVLAYISSAAELFDGSCD